MTRRSVHATAGLDLLCPGPDALEAEGGHRERGAVEFGAGPWRDPK